MEAGDFDDTPAPSGRPSLSQMRADFDDVSPPETTPTAKLASVHHQLLKTSTSGPLIFERQAVNFPVLDRATAGSDTAVELHSPGSASENRASMTPTPTMFRSTVLHDTRDLMFKSASPVQLLDDRGSNNARHNHDELISNSYNLYPAEKVEHGSSPHPGLLSHRSSPSQAAAFEDQAHSLLAEVRSSPQTLVPSPKMHLGHNWSAASFPDGHSTIPKIRPAFQAQAAHQTMTSQGSRGLTYLSSRNKVMPFAARTLDAPVSNLDDATFASGSSTAVSLRNTPAPQAADDSIRRFESFASSNPARGRIGKAQVASGSRCAEQSSEYNAGRIASSTKNHDFAIANSKVRPFDHAMDSGIRDSPYPAAESKIRPMFSPIRDIRNGSLDEAEDREQPGTLQHEPLRVPVAKVRSFTQESSLLSGVEDMHHHISKAQAFNLNGQASAFFLGAVDCQRCEISTRSDLHPRPSEAHGIARLERKTAPPDPPFLLPNKHSISLCDEYPTYNAPRLHSMRTCHYPPEDTALGEKETSEHQNQYMIPLPSRNSTAVLHLSRTSPEGTSSAEGCNQSSREPGALTDEPPSNASSHGFIPTQVTGGGPPVADQRSGSVQDVSLIHVSRSPELLVHAPIPVSKVRAFLQEYVPEENQGHSSVSKVRAADVSLAAVASPSTEKIESKFKAGYPSQRVQEEDFARRRSLGSVLDYRRTTQWLRDILKYREAYAAKFTRLPRKNELDAEYSPDPRRHSDTILSSILSGRFLRRSFSRPPKTNPNFDGRVIKQAVGDMERLVDEALAIASDAVYGPDPILSRSGRHLSTANARSRQQVSAYTDSLDESRSPGTHWRTDSLEDVDLDDAARPTRPTCRHAATYSELPRRPRLNEIIQSYSGKGVEMRMRQPSRGSDPTQDQSQAQPLVSFQIPCRESSKQIFHKEGEMDAQPDEGAHSRSNANGKSKTVKEILVELKPGEDVHSAYEGTGMKRGAGHHHTHQNGSSAHHGRKRGEQGLTQSDLAGHPMHSEHGISLRKRSHVSLRGAPGFSLAKSRKRQPTARDWSPIRKRFVAAVACISTALIGVILGIYAGLVPSIQYYIIDQSHATVHGNTGCFLGLALPTFFLWPLPLLHGRKPYILSSLVLAMPLLFPQALAVNSQRLTSTQSWRYMLLASRTLMGVALGFASMNFHSILLDLFGASLMSVNPHQEVVDRYDARRHGGGMGVWLGIWTWCWIGSIGVGFLVGACIIDSYPPAWGFYVSIIILAVVLFLNVLCPEVRRSAFRRSIAEVRTGSDISRRIARGEVMMHRVKTGPKWWGQEVYHGIALSLEMLRQPGFVVLTIYAAWIYAQVVLIIVLLGSLTSRLYQLRSPKVGILVASMALGACLAIPFQKANVFSRSRQAQMNSNLATLNRRVAWSSHLVRRTIFTLLLPLAGICYAAVSSGPPMHISVPTLFSSVVGFLSCLAIAECNGLVMETFDCSDLSSGMVGRQKGGSGKNQQKRTNYSSFPRVTAGFAAMHGLAFILAAGATALGGLVTRTLGQQVSTGVVAGILLILTAMLLLVLVRFTKVQIVPNCKSDAMDKLVEARRRSSTRRASMPNDPKAIMEEERAWRPVMIGNPTGKQRRMNILELGSLTRWQEIRKKNKLIDENAHLNRAALDQGLEALDDQMSDLGRDARDFFHRSSPRNKGLRRLRRTDEGSGTADDSMEVESIELAHVEPTSQGQARRAERSCAMSLTSGEDEDDGPQKRGRRRH
ncbi:hypothetical protein HIM_04402 [Hirsutella minnesotensis 3608]|uniref:Uncharacterized protein n=1 Tax=Hirsutella minnesotensis 3608 TaxID=1043627 RepID=A0A0F7ZPY7_9HYPO|nr:hypothetical protein HIM_04402 [Hirsutella minnesotensis 3608]